MSVLHGRDEHLGLVLSFRGKHWVPAKVWTLAWLWAWAQARVRGWRRCGCRHGCGSVPAYITSPVSGPDLSVAMWWHERNSSPVPCIQFFVWKLVRRGAIPRRPTWISHMNVHQPRPHEHRTYRTNNRCSMNSSDSIASLGGPTLFRVSVSIDIRSCSEALPVCSLLCPVCGLPDREDKIPLLSGSLPGYQCKLRHHSDSLSYYLPHKALIISLSK